MKDIMSEEQLDKLIQEFLQKWEKCEIASTKDAVENFEYYFQGGEAPDFNELDYSIEDFHNTKSLLEGYRKHLENKLEKINYTLSYVKW